MTESREGLLRKSLLSISQWIEWNWMIRRLPQRERDAERLEHWKAFFLAHACSKLQRRAFRLIKSEMWKHDGRLQDFSLLFISHGKNFSTLIILPQLSTGWWRIFEWIFKRMVRDKKLKQRKKNWNLIFFRWLRETRRGSYRKDVYETRRGRGRRGRGRRRRKGRG